ncbi:MAG: reverse transcriptase family protein, partial [Providencia heimbachae]|nr:reverse transcriptase family protein [Providencia heimbachae]
MPSLISEPTNNDTNAISETESIEHLALSPRGRGTTWSPPEIQLLKELEIRYANNKNINQAIAAHMPLKTAKQISSKRKSMRDTSARTLSTGSVADNVTVANDGVDFNTNPIPLSNSIQLVTGTSSTPTNHDTISGNSQELLNWRIKLLEYAKNVPLDNQTERDEGKLIMQNNICLLIENALNGAEDSTISQQLNTVFDKHLIPKLQANTTINGSTNKHSRKRNSSHRNRKRYIFARTQDMFDKCPRKLAELVINNSMEQIAPDIIRKPNNSDVESLYTKLWGTAGPNSIDFPPPANEHFSISTMLPPILEEEVLLRIKRNIKSKSAPGPDGIRKQDINKKWVSKCLTKLFNVMLALGIYPDAFKCNRTTLIPKQGKNPELASNWRPITIGSIISRLFSSLIEGRLRNCIPINIRQKGFTNENGCFANTFLLNGAIKLMKKRTGGTITQLDVSKAFDTIPHLAIYKALLYKGVPQFVASYIQSMYQDIYTTISIGNHSFSINIKRGVKQGDPLSPLLFNVVMDSLIEWLETQDSKLSIGELELGVLAFADDLILLNRDSASAEKALKLVSAYLQNLGMELSAPKCATFNIETSKDSWSIKDPLLHLG